MKINLSHRLFKSCLIFLNMFVVFLLIAAQHANAQEVGLTPAPSQIRSMDWSPDGLKVVVADGPFECGPFHSVRILQVATLQEIRKLTGQHYCYINSVSWSPDGTKIATSDDNGLSVVWNAIPVR